MVCTDGIPHPVYLRTCTTDTSTYQELLLRNEYALPLPFTPSVIVDAGANIGMASIYYALSYPAARIIAIEAEQSNFEMLRRNVAPYPNVTPVHAALWNRDGFISVSDPDPSSGASGNWAFVTHEGNGTKVRAITVPTLMKEANVERIDLLKVDIEGAEKEVFESCDWMDKVRALVVEFHDRFKPGCTAAMSTFANDFQTSQRGEMTFYVRH